MKAKVPTTEIINMLAGGMTIKEIAEKTESKKYSIARRIERLRSKHQCRTVTQLVVQLIDSGLSAT